VRPPDRSVGRAGRGAPSPITRVAQRGPVGTVLILPGAFRYGGREGDIKGDPPWNAGCVARRHGGRRCARLRSVRSEVLERCGSTSDSTRQRPGMDVTRTVLGRSTSVAPPDGPSHVFNGPGLQTLGHDPDDVRPVLPAPIQQPERERVIARRAMASEISMTTEPKRVLGERLSRHTAKMFASALRGLGIGMPLHRPLSPLTAGTPTCPGNAPAAGSDPTPRRP